MTESTKRYEGFQALAYLIEESNRLSKDPKIGRLLPK